MPSTPNYNIVLPTPDGDEDAWAPILNAAIVALEGYTYSAAQTAGAALTQAQGDARYVEQAGDTLTGALTLSGNPTQPLHAAPKQYADTGDAARVAKAGDTMSGDLVIAKAIPRVFLDKLTAPTAAAISGRLNGVMRWSVNIGGGGAESGGNVGSPFMIDRFDDAGASLGTAFRINRNDGATTISGALATSGPITLPGDPTLPLHAATRQYVLANAAGITDAPNDAVAYGRKSLAWAKVVDAAGDTITGALVAPVGSPTAPSLAVGQTTVGLARIAANSLSLIAVGGEQVRIASVASAVNYVQLSGAAAAGAVQIIPGGSDTNTDLQIRAKGTGAVRIQANSAELLRLTHSATPANQFQMSGANAGGSPSLVPVGSDTNIHLALGGKGTGGVLLATHLANFAQITGGAAASPVTYAAAGSDTDISINLTPKGTGGVNTTGDITVSKAAAFVGINKLASGQSASVRFYTALSERWRITSNTTAEAGGNVGSDLVFSRYDNAGASIGSPLTIARSTGIADFAVRPTVAGVPVVMQPDVDDLLAQIAALQARVVALEGRTP